jgi:REase_AHJR-like
MTSRHDHVREIAQRYRHAGFDVCIEPTGTAMPPRLSWLQGDLIAQRGNQRVLVLIDGADEQLRLLADVVEHTAGWRLEIDRFDELGEADRRPS